MKLSHCAAAGTGERPPSDAPCDVIDGRRGGDRSISGASGSLGERTERTVLRRSFCRDFQSILRLHRRMDPATTRMAAIACRDQRDGLAAKNARPLACTLNQSGFKQIHHTNPAYTHRPGQIQLLYLFEIDTDRLSMSILQLIQSIDRS